MDLDTDYRRMKARNFSVHNYCSPPPYPPPAGDNIFVSLISTWYPVCSAIQCALLFPNYAENHCNPLKKQMYCNEKYPPLAGGRGVDNNREIIQLLKKHNRPNSIWYNDFGNYRDFKLRGVRSSEIQNSRFKIQDLKFKWTVQRASKK